jgi:hypothetical protein
MINKNEFRIGGIIANFRTLRKDNIGIRYGSTSSPTIGQTDRNQWHAIKWIMLDSVYCILWKD